MNNRYEINYHPRKKVDPKKPKRTRSYFDLTDLKTEEVKRFTFSKDLGEGSYGYVRLFECGDEQIAVKALKELEVEEGKEEEYKEELHHMSKEDLKKWQDDIENEITLMREAYPHKKYYSVHHYQDDESDKNGFIYDARATMPVVPGVNLKKFAEQNIKTPEQMATLMLRVAQEMQRLHSEPRIIHGDAGCRNIMVIEDDDDYSVQYLDFGLAYRANGYAKVNFAKDKPSDTTSSDMAPERYPNRRLRARPVQDVYSLAKSFWKLIKTRKDKWRTDFLQQYPLLSQFIETGADPDWKERPNLSSLIEDLEYSIDWQTDISKSFQPLVKALDNEDYKKVNQLLDKNPDLYTDEALAQILYQLILNQQIEHIENLLEMRPDIPLDLLVNHNTCLHAAAIIGRLDILLLLLQKKSDLKVENEEGKQAIDVASATIKPVIKLFMFIAKYENRNTSGKNKSRMFDNSAYQQLTAARAIANAIMDDEGNKHEKIKNYLDVIDDTPKLKAIYDELLEVEILDKKGNMICDFFNSISSYL